MHEVDDAARIIGEAANPDANIIFGATIDENFSNQIKITVIATGFDMDLQRAYKKIENVSSVSSGSKEEEAVKEENKEEVVKLEDLGENPDIDTRFDFPTFLRRK